VSLDKAIASGKEHRKPYRKSKAFDRTCRCHGSCGWGEGNRKHSTEVRKQAANDRREPCEESPSKS
jgi:hypothetical protein